MVSLARRFFCVGGWGYQPSPCCLSKIALLVQPDLHLKPDLPKGAKIVPEVAKVSIVGQPGSKLTPKCVPKWLQNAIYCQCEN